MSKRKKRKVIQIESKNIRFFPLMDTKLQIEAIELTFLEIQVDLDFI